MSKRIILLTVPKINNYIEAFLFSDSDIDGFRNTLICSLSSCIAHNSKITATRNEAAHGGAAMKKPDKRNVERTVLQKTTFL